MACELHEPSRMNIRRATLPWNAVVAVTLACARSLTACGSPENDAWPIKADYQLVTQKLENHISDWWLDDDPQAPELLTRQWTLVGEWVAAWLDAHPEECLDGVGAALADLAEGSDAEYLRLNDDAVVAVAPGPIGNVFIVARSDGRFHLAWNTAQTQDATGEEANILAAWLPENARRGDRGPYWAASGSAGSVIPRLGVLPSDAHGRPRFYIDGAYAQSAGGTIGAQMSVWLWDGTTARPQIARTYALMVDQAVGARVEGDQLLVQEKKFFRTFFGCGMCEERQTDWTVRLAPDGVEDLGEESRVPELDVVDELLFRVIHDQPAIDVAAPSAIEFAKRMVEEARTAIPDADWEEFPSLGMIDEWAVWSSGRILCLSLDLAGSILFTLTRAGGKLFITEIQKTDESCHPR
jgi:hypothetical protein